MSSPFQYAPAPESRSIVDIAPSYGLFIDGEFVDGTGEAFKTVNPATEEVLAEVAEASAEDVDLAVKAARRAHSRVWSRMSGRERGKYLFRIARILQERSREFAVLESLDGGKPIKESRDVDLPLAAAHFFYYAGWADKLEHAGYGPDPRPHGVAAQVIPWNFPLLMAAWKLAPALAAGNTCVLKPAETTPLTALLFADLLRQAELPPGVVNIVTGAGATGAALVGHPGVDPVNATAFTSSCPTSATPVAPAPVMMLTTPGGRSACCTISANSSAVSGVVSAGLSTTVFPAASAGAIFHASIISGKFHGMTCAATPRERGSAPSPAWSSLSAQPA